MKVVLLDREGTIIVDPPYDRVDAPSKIQLLPDSLPALKLLASHGYSVVIITNQTNIAQGRVTEDGFWVLHDIVLQLIGPSGIKVLKTYVCPHNADEGCDCRKPQPGLLQQAMHDFNLSPDETFMVGDRDSDIAAGQNARIKTILVKTGKHPTTANATYTVQNLLEAAQHIVASSPTAASDFRS